MKKLLLWMLVGFTLILTACGTQPAAELPQDYMGASGMLFPAVVGAADNANAQLSLQDGAWYYDFGSVEVGGPSYPLAFRVDLPAEEIASVEAMVTDNDGFVIDTTSVYQQGELFTVLVDSTASTGNHAGVVIINGITASGQDFRALFVAVVEVL